jgi:superfamily II DNA/RNA helicase
VFWNVDRVDRTRITAEAVQTVFPALIFCRTRRGSDRLARQLGQAGVRVSMIHGGRSQNQRTRALADFSNRRLQALVATDVAARGIHVERVASVIHYDPPEDHKTYLHRSGRTARAGQGGLVVSLVQADQVRDFRRMQQKIGLDEPFTDPNPGALVDLRSGLTPVPARAEAPDGAGEEETASSPGRRTDSSSHGRRNRRTSSAPRGDGSNTRRRRKARHTGRGGRSQDRSGSPRLPQDGGGTPNRKARRAHLQPRPSESPGSGSS